MNRKQSKSMFLKSTIGILHPGQMGERLAKSLLQSGNSVLWCSSSRSQATRDRATKLGLIEVDSFESFLARCEGLISICPPSEAVAVAKSVGGYKGFYCEANAISPMTATSIMSIIKNNGGKYVDGSVISFAGLRLYLSGPHAEEFRDKFYCKEVQSGDLKELKVIVMNSKSPVAASSLKAVYSGWDKALSAHTINIHALAMECDVHNELLEECKISQPSFIQRSEEVLPTIPGKAWRFIGEMQEDMKLCKLHNLPHNFHSAAVEVFERLDEHKNKPTGSVSLSQMLDSLKYRSLSNSSNHSNGKSSSKNNNQW